MNAINIIPKKTDSCPVMGDFAYAKKMNVSWANRKVGDIVLFDFNHNGTSDHIGIVIGLNKDGSITTIEGNTGKGSNTNGGQVQIRTRYRSQVNYFVRPKYTKDITPQMVIDTAKAEVGVKEYPKNSNKVKYNQWYYGKNTSAYWCCTFVCWVFAHIKEPIIPATKPIDKYGYSIPNPTLKKGSGGTRVKELQRFLNWYLAEYFRVNKIAKLKTDGEFGSKTEKALGVFQDTESIFVDGVFGKISYSKAIQYLPEPPEPEPPKPKTKADEIIENINLYAYPYKTSSKKYSYKNGKPRAEYKSALKKFMKKSKKISQSDCGYFVSTVYRSVGCKGFLALAGRKEKFPKVPSTVKVVHNGGKIKSGELKPGDAIRYKKKNGGQHTLIYYGNGKIAEAGREHYFPAIKKNTKKYNKSNVKTSTIQIIRAK